MFHNATQIDQLAERYKTNPILCDAAALLKEYKDTIVHRHGEDGWNPTHPAVVAASKLIVFIEYTLQDKKAFTKAKTPIKQYCRQNDIPFPDPEVREQQERKAEAILYLKSLLRMGQTIYTVNIRERSQKRCYAVLVTVEGQIRNISGRVAFATDAEWDGHGVFFQSASDIPNQLSYALYGYDSKGNWTIRRIQEYDENNFHAGFTFRHKEL